jgi:hypothetical protein
MIADRLCPQNTKIAALGKWIITGAITGMVSSALGIPIAHALTLHTLNRGLIFGFHALFNSYFPE